MKLTDKEYIERIQHDDDRAMEMFFHDCRDYFMSVYSTYFVREDIREDIFQQSFVKLWTEIETKRIFLHGEDGCIYRVNKAKSSQRLSSGLVRYLVSIARNDYMEWIRHDVLGGHGSLSEYDRTVDVVENVFPYLTDKERREQIVAACVQELPPRCKDILTKFYYDEMKLDEILLSRGEKHISKNGLKSSKHKCMENLKNKVKHIFTEYRLKY